MSANNLMTALMHAHFPGLRDRMEREIDPVAEGRMPTLPVPTIPKQCEPQEPTPPWGRTFAECGYATPGYFDPTNEPHPVTDSLNDEGEE